MEDSDSEENSHISDGNLSEQGQVEVNGVSLQAIPYLGMNINRGRDRKMLSSIVEVMEDSDSEENSHISDGNLSEQGQVEVNAHGAPVAAQDIARGGEVLVATDENVVRMV